MAEGWVPLSKRSPVPNRASVVFFQPLSSIGRLGNLHLSAPFIFIFIERLLIEQPFYPLRWILCGVNGL